MNLSLRSLAFAVFAAVLLSGCTTLSPGNYKTFVVGEEWQVPGQPFSLSSGQIVVSGSSSAMDMALALMPEDFTPYIHMGIVVVEDGTPYVYESLGNPSLNLDPEIPPTATIEGNITRTPFVRFVQRYFFVEVFEPRRADTEKVAEFAREHFAAGTPFDKFFDYEDEGAFFCAEFVGRALEHGGYPPLQTVPNRPNESISIVMNWLQVPEETLPPKELIRDSERVLLVSRRSEVEIMILNEVKRELHRRFTADQRLGNVFRWNVTRPTLRFPTELFYTRSMGMRDELPADQEAVAAAVRAMADRLFGPFETPQT